MCSDHWRKNLPILGLKCRTYAIDLLGYGYSDKPSPRYISNPSRGSGCVHLRMVPGMPERTQHDKLSSSCAETWA